MALDGEWLRRLARATGVDEKWASAALRDQQRREAERMKEIKEETRRAFERMLAEHRSLVEAELRLEAEAGRPLPFVEAPWPVVVSAAVPPDTVLAASGLTADGLREAIRRHDEAVAQAAIANGSVLAHSPRGIGLRHDSDAYEAMLRSYVQMQANPMPLKPAPQPKPLPTERRVGGIVAYRGWKLTSHVSSLLQSLSMTTVWPGPVLIAEGWPKERVDGAAVLRVARETARGIHAVRADRVAELLRAYRCEVVGEVLLYGHVVEHERGFRAERCLIRRLVVVDAAHVLQEPQLCERLAARYGCEVGTDVRALVA